ncbi:hypothetical protein ACIQNK_30570 [Streptomyces sp. NPDC091273]|uniref:hypothetical protein n=1 Tax=Streptomyces sp. NPDC091273 TaxID=3365982 RepID=UPI003823B311
MIEGECAAPSLNGLAEEVTAVLNARHDRGVEAFERILNAVAGHGHRDPEALAAALGPVPRELTVAAHPRVRPFLLSVPSRTTGAVEPHHLVDRLTAYARLGITRARLTSDRHCCGVAADPPIPMW